MFYSGANVMAVDKRLIPKSAYTGKYIKCRTFSRKVEVFPQCRLILQTPFYTGLADPCSIRKPISQLTIGQLSGVKMCTNREIQAWYRKNLLDASTAIARCGRRNQIHTTDSQEQVASMVMSRNTRRKHQQMLWREQEDRQGDSTQSTQIHLKSHAQPGHLLTIKEEDVDFSGNTPHGHIRSQS